MGNISTWSTTAASNNQTPPDGWPEGMAPSAVNDTARETHAAVRRWYEDHSWVDLGHTVTYVSASSFTIATDVTAQYHFGRALKMYGSTMGTLYGYVTSTAYSAPNTTITVALHSGALTSNFSQVYLAQQANASPLGIMHRTQNYLWQGSLSNNPWQFGTTFTSPTSAASVADGVRIYYSTTGTVTVTRDASVVPTLAQSGYKSTYSLKVACTGTDASIAATDYLGLWMSIEGYDFASLAQKPMVLSFWVYAFATGTYCVAFRNSGADRTYVAEYTVNASNTWEKKQIAILASPSAGTWDYINGTGLSVVFALVAGSSVQTTAGAWQSGAYLATSNQTNFLSSTSNTFYLEQIQLEEGQIATPFRAWDRVELLNKANRYYFKSFATDTAPAQNTSLSGSFGVCSAGTSSGTTFYSVRFPVPMRTTPSITTYNPLAAASGWYRGSDGANIAAAADNITNTGFRIANSVDSADSATHHIHATADARLA